MKLVNSRLKETTGLTTQVLANKSLEKNMGRTEGEKSTQWLLSTWGDSA